MRLWWKPGHIPGPVSAGTRTLPLSHCGVQQLLVFLHFLCFGHRNMLENHILFCFLSEVIDLLLVYQSIRVKLSSGVVTWCSRNQDQASDCVLLVFRHSAAGENQSGQRNPEHLHRVTHLHQWRSELCLCVCVCKDVLMFVLCVQVFLRQQQQVHLISAPPEQPAEENHRRGKNHSPSAGHSLNSNQPPELKGTGLFQSGLPRSEGLRLREVVSWCQRLCLQ